MVLNGEMSFLHYDVNIFLASSTANNQKHVLLFFSFLHFSAKNRDSFSAVHLNHADKNTPACNCVRLFEEDRVAFFTSRNIQVGEELCFDYMTKSKLLSRSFTAVAINSSNFYVYACSTNCSRSCNSNHFAISKYSIQTKRIRPNTGTCSTCYIKPR